MDEQVEGLTALVDDAQKAIAEKALEAVTAEEDEIVEMSNAELERRLAAILGNQSRRSRQTFNKNGKFIRH